MVATELNKIYMYPLNGQDEHIQWWICSWVGMLAFCGHGRQVFATAAVSSSSRGHQKKERAITVIRKVKWSSCNSSSKAWRNAAGMTTHFCQSRQPDSTESSCLTLCYGVRSAGTLVSQLWEITYRTLQIVGSCCDAWATSAADTGKGWKKHWIYSVVSSLFLLFLSMVQINWGV